VLLPLSLLGDAMDDNWYWWWKDWNFEASIWLWKTMIFHYI
jgi:hypothetical protein